ncbi:GGDEF/EAL domain-containing response regulator [Paenibacillus ferrarius]|uniref:GGDEF/EAL domain-containing response regulator n=1 Tax=Paenibacillus ferrarius TaxID=1469647 RepID=UPI003D271745
MSLIDRYGVLVISDSEQVQGVMTTILGTDRQFQLVGISAHGSSVLEEIWRMRPDLVILDMELLGGRALPVLQMIMDHRPTPVVVLSTLASEASMPTIQAMRLGAADYFHKEMLEERGGRGMNDYFLERCKVAVQQGMKSVHQASGESAERNLAKFQEEQQFQRRMAIEFQLRKAILQGELRIVYQPVVDLNTSLMVGLECLIRWHNVELGEVSPSEFIPIAEETGVIHDIGEWVLREACLQNKLWQDAGLPAIFVAVNVSRCQFNDPRLSGMIEDILRETGLQPGYLELEITESLSMDAKLAEGALASLKRLGVRIAMDDFGTGYSSFGYLRDFPIDKMKIDQSFIKGLKHRHVNAVIVQTMITMAQHLGLAVVAEGVETEEELNILREYGCRYVQGYYFSRPVEFQQIENMLVHLS